MKRYIDADKLSIHFKTLVEHAEMEGLYNQAHLYERCAKLIEDTPTADVVEVVRCKDCRYCVQAHYEEEGEKPYIKLKCKWSNYSHQPNDYCSCAKRREEGE